jgi:signal transduction histidine kinase/integral membrane sensor domain MASE1/ActR/RegA family two-component response regulator
MSAERNGRVADWWAAPRDVIPPLALVVVYIATAKLGFVAAFAVGHVSPVWPAAGLAIWAVLHFGVQIWPAIWVAALIANVTTHVPPIPAAALATGTTLEALVAFWLLRDFADVDRRLDRLRHVTAFILGGAVASTTISATIGVTTLGVAGLQPWSRFGMLWCVWWLGDATGALLVTPLLFAAPIVWRASGRRMREGALLGTIAIMVTTFVFAAPTSQLGGRHPLEFVVFPLVIWAGLRFAHYGAALASAGISFIAVWGTLHGAGPFSANPGSVEDNIILLQIFTAVIATSGLILGGAIADRNRSERLRLADLTLTAILAEDRELPETAARMLRAACETLAWDVAIMWRASDDHTTLEYVDSWRSDAGGDVFIADSRARRFDAGQGLPGRVLESAAPAWVYDVALDGNFPRREAAKQARLHGAFACPILLGGKVLGVFEFFAREPRRFDREVSTLIASAGSQAGQFIDRKRAEKERAELLARERAARVEAEDANRTKDQFLATVSHELRTPLTAILGWTAMLRTREFEPHRIARIYDSLYRNAQVQAQIVNDLLDVSRIVSGQLRLELQPTDVCEVARVSLETIRPTAVAKQVALVSNIPAATCPVSGDAARLQQIVWNLLSNAIKFTHAGGRVTLNVASTPTNVRIEVSDTGIGIAAHALPRVFERFWQADSTPTRMYTGLGLGLALVRHLVELHGGDVSATSDGLNRGSTFTVSLPVPAHIVQGRPAGLLGAAGHRHDRLDLDVMTALVVDDDEPTREVLAAILANHGARVTGAACASEALDVLERSQPDVMVIDIAMPGEDGYSLLNRIRQREALVGKAPVPAIAVTACAASEHRDEALRRGFSRYLAKPVLPSDLIATVLDLTRPNENHV